MISPLPAAPRRGPAGALAREPIRTAWMVIWLSAFALLLLLLVVGAVLLHYIASAVQPQAALLSGKTGTVLVQEPIWPRPFAAHADQALASGDTIQTDTNSEATAIIQFQDGSSVLLKPGTTIQLISLRSNRYNLLSGPRRLIDLELRSGKLEANVSKYPDSSSRFRISSLGTDIAITDGISDVWLTQPRSSTPLPNVTPQAASFSNSCCATQVLTQTGAAMVMAPGGTTELRGDERATIPMGGAPIVSQHSSWDLLANWSLLAGADGYPEPWEPTFDTTDPDRQHHFAITGGAQSAVHLWSTGSQKHHEGVYFRQEINRDVRDFLNLDLVVSFKINAQTLAGGGFEGTEYPFRVAVDYLDRAGRETTWYEGYYIVPADSKTIVRAAQQVPPGVWFPPRPDQGVLRLSTLPDPPVYVKYVEFSASGRDFDTDVREVRLLAQ